MKASPRIPQVALNRSLVITFAGLTPSAISCFGSSWNRTPAIDSLAADGVCWDRVICHTTDSRQVWLDWFLRCSGSIDGAIHVLVTDDSELAALVVDGPSGDKCEVVLHPIHVDSESASVVSIEDSHVAELFRVAVDRLREEGGNASIWLHSRFLQECWDAPRELFPVDDILEDSFDDPEGDLAGSVESRDHADHKEQTDLVAAVCPAIFDTVVPPQHEITDSDDIDLAMAWMRTYGCQVRLIDHLLDDLIDIAEQADVPIVLAGTSGFALGQNGFIGHSVGPLRSCHVVVPVVTNRGGPLRIRRVVGTNEIADAIRQISTERDAWLPPTEWAIANQVTPIDDEDLRPLVTTEATNAKQCVHTADWFYVRDLDDSDALFLKPDDLHDANNVYRLKPAVIDAFRDLA